MGDNSEKIILGKNNYVGDALILLNNYNVKIYDPEIINVNDYYEVKGGSIKIEDVFYKAEYTKWKEPLKKGRKFFI